MHNHAVYVSIWFGHHVIFSTFCICTQQQACLLLIAYAYSMPNRWKINFQKQTLFPKCWINEKQFVRSMCWSSPIVPSSASNSLNFDDFSNWNPVPYCVRSLTVACISFMSMLQSAIAECTQYLICIWHIHLVGNKQILCKVNVCSLLQRPAICWTWD